MDPIKVETLIVAPLQKVWDSYTIPESICEWNAASEDWHTTKAENDLREGGVFSFRMEARDGSEGFDFGGMYQEVVPKERIAYVMDDGRRVVTMFAEEEEGVRLTTIFDPESQNSADLQKAGWQAILDNFKRYAEQ